MERKINCGRFTLKSSFKVIVICRRVVGSCCDTRLKENEIGRFNIIMLVLIVFFIYLFLFSKSNLQKSSRAGRVR